MKHIRLAVNITKSTNTFNRYRQQLSNITHILIFFCLVKLIKLNYLAMIGIPTFIHDGAEHWLDKNTRSAKQKKLFL